MDDSCCGITGSCCSVDDSGCVSSEGGDCCDEEEGGKGNVKADVCGSTGCACGSCGCLASMCCGEIDRCDNEEESGLQRRRRVETTKMKKGEIAGIEAIAMLELAATEQHKTT